MEDGIVKIGDVGLSKFIAPSRHSAQTQSVGTVHYMAPEVAKGRYGREVDVYATGVILYEMLTGQLPFDGESTGEILMKHLSEPPDLEKLPPRLQGVIGKALQKDPKARYSRIEALQRAFDDAVLGIGEPEPVPQKSGEPIVERYIAPTEIGDGVHVEIQTANSHKQVHLQNNPAKTLPGFVKGALVALLAVFILRGMNGGGGVAFSFLIIMMAIGGMIGHRIHNKKPTGRSSKKPKPVPVKKQVVAPAKPIPAKRSVVDLFGAMFATVPISALLITCLSFLKPSLLGGANHVEQITPATLGFFSVMTIISTWMIMIVPYFSKVADWRKKVSGYHFGLAGAIVGLAAFALDQYLLVDVLGRGSSAIFKQLGDQRLIVDSQPSILGYIAFFATFFAFRNWQEMISPLRRHRFSVIAVLVTVFVAWLATMVFAFPGEIAIAWAVVISCAVQLAAPINEHQQHRRSRRVA